MEFEQLMNIEVSTVSRKLQPLSRTAAAAFIITRQSILRSGATSIPEALRLAPGVEAAQISPNHWSVAIRGFGGYLSNKLLVLIDGRSVYTSSFGGVYWEQQHVTLDDIEHIEVIRGPGATAWGANAVNGVINIITRHAAETTGTQINVKAGDREQSITLRQGGEMGENSYWRAFASSKQGDGFDNLSGDELSNGFEHHQAGFRLDIATTARDEVTLQGQVQQIHDHQALEIPDHFNPPTFTQPINRRANIDNHFLSVRWEHSDTINSTFILQSYIQQYEQQTFVTAEDISRFDLDFQHHFAKRYHDIVWGMGYRKNRARFNEDGALANVNRNHHRIYSGFIEDEIELSPHRFWLTLGSKLEHNDDTGLELQPSLRALWRRNDQHSLWGSLTRAVRTPSRVDTDVELVSSVSQPDFSPLPVAIHVQGNPDFKSEKLTAWEFGYRFNNTSAWSMDATVFYHDYDDIRDSQPAGFSFNGDHLQQNLRIDNVLEGIGYGVELSTHWFISPTLQCQLAYTAQTRDLRYKPGAQPISAPNDTPFVRASPEHILSVNTHWKFRPGLTWNLWLRAVSDEPSDRVDHFVTLDTTVGWQPSPGIRFALVGKNLLENRHFEFDEEGFAVSAKVPRSLMFTLKLDY